MEIKEITYTRRFNLGSYEHEELSLQAVIGEDEGWEEAISRLQQICLNATMKNKEHNQNGGQHVRS